MTADGAVVAGHLAVAMCPTVLHAVVVKNTTWKDSVMTVAAPGWEFFWTELCYETALLEREIRAADDAARSGGQDEWKDPVMPIVAPGLLRLVQGQLWA